MKLTSIKTRRLVLFLALFLTVAASVRIWMSDNPTDDAVVVLAKPDRAGVKKVALVSQHTDPNLFAPRIPSKVSKDIFLVKEMPTQESQRISQAPLAVAPSPIVTTPPPAIAASPVAPALPFTYIGKLLEDGHYTVFLAGNGRNYAAKEGQTVAQIYRVEEITPPLMTVTYIPMSIKQTLSIGEKN